jgi:hypothetical protein
MRLSLFLGNGRLYGIARLLVIPVQRAYTTLRQALYYLLRPQFLEKLHPARSGATHQPRTVKTLAARFQHLTTVVAGDTYDHVLT